METIRKGSFYMSAMKDLLIGIVEYVEDETGLPESYIYHEIAEMYKGGLVNSRTWDFNAKDVVQYIKSKTEAN